MALKLYNETDIEAIADAIRGKNGSSDTYKVSEMADAIDDIPTGGGGGADVDTGTFTPSSNMLDVTLNTTKQRDNIVIWTSPAPNDSDCICGTFATFMWTSSIKGAYWYGTTPTGIASIASASHTASTFTIKPHNTTRHFSAGVTYNWMAW